MIAPSIKRCSVCRKWWFGLELHSTSGYGGDLENRPYGMARGAVGYWVQRCSACGYCASTVSEPCTKGQRERLGSSEYIAQLRNQDFPDLSNSYLCMAMLQEIEEKYSDVLGAIMNAAWVCDDMHAADAASACREYAIALLADPTYSDFDLFTADYAYNLRPEDWNLETFTVAVRANKIRLRNEHWKIVDPQTCNPEEMWLGFVTRKVQVTETYLAKQVGSRELLLAELLRRVGRFSESIEATKRGLGIIVREDIRPILLFVQQLATDKDSGFHRREECTSVGA